MGLRKKLMVKTLLSGFSLLTHRADMDQEKVNLCIEKVESIADFVLSHKRQPTAQEINSLIGWRGG